MEKTRRDVLYLTGTSVIAATAGCQTSTENTTSTERTTSTANTDTATSNPNTPENGFTDEEGTFEEPVTDRTTFAEAYNATVPGSGFASLSDGRVNEIREIGENGSVSEALEQANTLLEGRKDPAARTTFKKIVHDDLGYNQDEVRLLERRMSDGHDYLAVMVKNDEGDWVKDLMGFTGSEEGYLRHNENSLDHSGEQGLFDLWNQEKGVQSATAWEQIKQGILSFGSREETGEERWSEIATTYSRRNDHIVVGEDVDVGEVCYSQAAAEVIAEIQDFDANDVHNQEMEMVENVTEFYHNDLGDGYLKVDITSGTVGEGQRSLTELESGEVLYAKEVGEEAYDEAVLSLYEAEN